MQVADSIAKPSDQILVTGASGFIGAKVVERLLELGFSRIRCFTRSAGGSPRLQQCAAAPGAAASLQVMSGNLLSREDCIAAAKDAVIVYHLAAGRGEKSFPDAFMNSVVTTRNLLDALLQQSCLRRFVNISSFATYTNRNKPSRVLDETCPVEERPELRGDPYCFAKVKQDELVREYGRRGVPFVILKPGYVYGPGNPGISGRVGVDTFGIFAHLGGGNPVPLSFVDNCADAVVLAGLSPGIDGEVFNVVDDRLPSSRRFLRQYKRHVRPFKSVYVPRFASYLFCLAWEKYSTWSEGQLPPAFNRLRWHSEWKGSGYTNEKLKSRLGWSPRVNVEDGLTRHFAACREKNKHA